MRFQAYTLHLSPSKSVEYCSCCVRFRSAFLALVEGSTVTRLQAVQPASQTDRQTCATLLCIAVSTRWQVQEWHLDESGVDFDV